MQRIIADEEGGYVSRKCKGRRNHYGLHADRPFRHPVVAHRDVSLLFYLILGLGFRTDRTSEARGRNFRITMGPNGATRVVYLAQLALPQRLVALARAPGGEPSEHRTISTKKVPGHRPKTAFGSPTELDSSGQVYTYGFDVLICPPAKV